MTRLYRLALVTAISTYALIVLGGITRITESGMGCADDWPRCHGRWLPLWTLESIIEYLHRTVAAYIGILVLALVIGVFLVRGISLRTRLVAIVSLGLVIFQAMLGAVTVWRELPANIVTAHLGTAMLFFAFTLLTLYFIALDRGAPGWMVNAGRDPDAPTDRRFATVAKVSALIIFLLMLSGGMTSTTGAALACTDWPLCRGTTVLPENSNQYIYIHMSHRLVALIGTAAVVAVALAARRWSAPRPARRLTDVALGIIGIQILIGAGYVFSLGNNWLAAAHLATATLLWAAMLGIVVVARQPLEEGETREAGVPRQPERIGARSGAPAPAQTSSVQMSAQPAGVDVAHPANMPPTHTGVGAVALAAPPTYPRLSFGLTDVRRMRAVATDYLALTKPGILTLLLVTTLGAMLIAAEGVPPLALVLATMLGGLLAAGGANVINCYLDRDLDAAMPRTSRRGTAAGRISPRAALTFGVTLSTLSVLTLGLLVNWLAAGLALAGNLYYVFVYTKWLKRTTPHNIVIGGAAGAVPPLVGWAAVTGELTPAAWVLFAIIFYWTPPHFWALALLKQGEYGRVQVPMLPVVAGAEETRRQIVLYSVLLASVALLLVPLALGWVYLLAALTLNAIFLALAIRLFVAPSKRLARHLFMYSLWYLALMFGAMVADTLLLT